MDQTNEVLPVEQQAQRGELKPNDEAVSKLSRLPSSQGTFARGPALTLSGPDLILGKTLMSDAVIYPIFYGDWSKRRMDKTVDFVSSIGTSDWFEVDKKSYGGGSITVGEQIILDQKYSRGKTLYDIDSWDTTSLAKHYEPSRHGDTFIEMLDSYFNTGDLHVHKDAIYTFFLAADVNVVDYTDEIANQYNLTQEQFCTYNNIYYRFGEGHKHPNVIKYMVVTASAMCRTQNNGPIGDEVLDNIFPSIATQIIGTTGNPMYGFSETTAQGFVVQDSADLKEKFAPYVGWPNFFMCNGLYQNVCPVSGKTHVHKVDYATCPELVQTYTKSIHNYFFSYNTDLSTWECYESSKPLYNAVIGEYKILVNGIYKNSGGICINYNAPGCSDELNVIMASNVPSWFFPK